MPIERLYFVSGLGADERVFQFLDLPGIEKVHIHWIPTTKDESLGIYCKKLTAQIFTTINSGIVGVSFGGIVVQEIAKMLDFEKVIIISSVKSIKEFTWHFRLLQWLRMDRWIPEDRKAIAKTHWLTEKMFGVKNEKERKILKQILDDLDPVFLKWAVDAMMEWNQIVAPSGIIHIHGDADKVFSIKKIKGCITITNGGHLMLLSKAKEISRIIQSELIT